MTKQIKKLSIKEISLSELKEKLRDLRSPVDATDGNDYVISKIIQVKTYKYNDDFAPFELESYKWEVRLTKVEKIDDKE